MLIKGTEGFLPIQNNTTRRTPALGGKRARRQDSRYDHLSLSMPEEETRNFREAVASLSRQVRTSTTTGKIQELRRQVSSGEYQAAARETASRILLLEEGE